MHGRSSLMESLVWLFPFLCVKREERREKRGERREKREERREKKRQDEKEERI